MIKTIFRCHARIQKHSFLQSALDLEIEWDLVDVFTETFSTPNLEQSAARLLKSLISAMRDNAARYTMKLVSGR